MFYKQTNGLDMRVFAAKTNDDLLSFMTNGKLCKKFRLLILVSFLAFPSTFYFNLRSFYLTFAYDY